MTKAKDDAVVLSLAIQREEAQRAAQHQAHRMPCVPWRGAGGEIGRCIYCGKWPDAITAYYGDRAESSLANRAR